MATGANTPVVGVVLNTATSLSASQVSTSSLSPGGQSNVRQSSLGPMTPLNGEVKVLDKKRLDELVKEVDPMEQLDEEVEEMLYQIADDFIDNVVTSSCQLAKHRNSNALEVKDVQLNLERNWNMWIPGYGSSDEGRVYKKSAASEAHKQRMALIKKTLKKF